MRSSKDPTVFFPRSHRKERPSPPRNSSSVLRSAPVRAGLFAALCLALAACNDQSESAGPPRQPPGEVEVGVMVMHPQSVVITAELPGRTAASLVAEVRPQVGGLIVAREFKEGGNVEEGDVLYRIDPASYRATYDAAVAALQKAEAAVPSAQARIERYDGLVKQNAVSQQDVDDARTALLEANADVAAAKAAAEIARINLEYTQVRAPISGRVGASSVTVGALVTADQETALTTIRTLDPINVNVIQSTTNLLRLRRAIDEGRIKIAGDNVAVRLKLADGSYYEHSGTLEFMDTTIDTTTGTFTVRAEFPNPDQLLLPGMYVRGILEEGVAEGSFLVPQRAVTHDAEGAAIAKFVTAEGTVESRSLTVQRSIGNSWLVDGGISDGDQLILEGASTVADGQTVGVREVSIDPATGAVRSNQAGGAETGDASDAASPEAIRG